MKEQSRFKQISIICFIAMLVLFVVHVQILVMFNRQEVVIHGNDSSQKAYMEIDPHPLVERRLLMVSGSSLWSSEFAELRALSENLLPLEFPQVYFFDMRKTNSFGERGALGQVDESLTRLAPHRPL